MSHNCGCKKAKRIAQRAQRQGRLMTEQEALVALAADLDIDPDELRAHIYPPDQSPQ